jgi:hypothetical protein
MRYRERNLEDAAGDEKDIEDNFFRVCCKGQRIFF